MLTAYLCTCTASTTSLSTYSQSFCFMMLEYSTKQKEEEKRREKRQLHIQGPFPSRLYGTDSVRHHLHLPGANAASPLKAARFRC